MNIHQFRFSYHVKDLTPEQRAAAQPYIREQLPEDISYRTFQGDISALLRVLPGVEITIAGEELPATTWEAITNRLERIEAKIAAAPTVVNERCNVTVPGIGLMAIREVCVELDLCTDRLQSLLDEGWRILAICPQPDQRRPDYVLGRNEKVRS